MQTETNSTSKPFSGENSDSYLLPLESGKAVALIMNFPQHHSCVLRTNQTVSQKCQTFASIHPGWSVPKSCCTSGIKKGFVLMGLTLFLR